MKSHIAVGVLGALLLTVSTATFLLMTRTTDAADVPNGAVRARDQQVQVTRNAVASLQANVDTFRFELSYHGPNPKAYRSLYLSVKPPAEGAERASIQISEHQALLLIGCLARDGALYRGSVNSEKSLVRPKGPHYFLYVQATQGAAYFEYIPWGDKPYRWHGISRPPLLQQVSNLKGVLVGEAANGIDALAKPLEANAQLKGA